MFLWRLGQFILVRIWSVSTCTCGIRTKKHPCSNAWWPPSLLSCMKSHFLSTSAKCKNRNKGTHLNKQKSTDRGGEGGLCAGPTPASTERCFLFAVFRVRPCHIMWMRMWVGDSLDNVGFTNVSRLQKHLLYIIFLAGPQQNSSLVNSSQQASFLPSLWMAQITGF